MAQLWPNNVCPNVVSFLANNYVCQLTTPNIFFKSMRQSLFNKYYQIIFVNVDIMILQKDMVFMAQNYPKMYKI